MGTDYTSDSFFKEKNISSKSLKIRPLSLTTISMVKVFVNFEEAFFENNPIYNGIFRYIRRYLVKNGRSTFVGIRHVRLGPEGSFEFDVFHDQDFQIDNMNLMSVVAQLIEDLL